MKDSLSVAIIIGVLLTPYFVVAICDAPVCNEMDGLLLQESVSDGVQVGFTIRFHRNLLDSEITYFSQQGINFGFPPRFIGPVYLVQANEEAIRRISTNPLFVQAEPLNKWGLTSPRDVSITETYVKSAWNTLDESGLNLTGKGILVADLDTGIQWNHPDFFFADGTSVAWTDSNSNGQFDSGVDGIDLNGDSVIQSNERLYLLDVNNDGIYQTDIDWLWLDNGTTVGALDPHDAFFVTADANSDSTLNPSEVLVRLKTPKTKYVVHKPDGSIKCWERGVNLTSTTFQDVDGHGTSVAGILNGGQLGYHKYVGIAPEAEIMAINLFGNDGLTVEEGLIWAKDHGADAILIEIGSWTYQYLDGSSNVEAMIDQLTAEGIPVIVPAGNLHGQNRHARQVVNASTCCLTRFYAPDLSPSPAISTLYITVLSRNDLSNIFVTLNEPTGGYGTDYILMSLGEGYMNWMISATGTAITIETFRSVSSRGTRMLALRISGTIIHTSSWTLSISNTIATEYEYYISDDQTAWGGGAEWQDGVNETTTITWPSTADTAITVGSYLSRNIWSPGYGNIAPYSSSGPRIDGISKMTVAAPGGWDVVSSWSNSSTYPTWFTQGQNGLPVYSVFGGNTLFGGTSAAGPHVAATAALMLQLNPDCGRLVKDVIGQTSYNDSYTGNLAMYPGSPDVRWGYGKLNSSLAVEEVAKIPRIISLEIYPSNQMYYDSILLTAETKNEHYVNLTYTTNDWASNVTIGMQWNGTHYNGNISAQPYLTQVAFKVIAVNTTSINHAIREGDYIIGDDIPPIIHSFSLNATIIYADTVVKVSANVSEPLNASGIALVKAEVSTDNWTSYDSITMEPDDDLYTSILPSFEAASVVSYRIMAQDSAGLVARTASKNYTVSADPTSTDTETTTTTTPTSQPGVMELLETYWIYIALVLVLLMIIRARKRK